MRALIIIFALIATASSLCIVKGKRYKPNEKWKEGGNELTLVKQCKKEKHGWKPKVVECIIENGKIKIPRNKRVVLEKGHKTCWCDYSHGDEDVGATCEML